MQPQRHSAIATLCASGAATRYGWTQDTANIRWARELAEAMRPFTTGSDYVNHIGLEAEEGTDRIRAAFAANYDRLVVLKNRYDPTNLFRHNQNRRSRRAIDRVPAGRAPHSLLRHGSRTAAAAHRSRGSAQGASAALYECRGLPQTAIAGELSWISL